MNKMINFAQVLEADQIKELHRMNCACDANIRNAKVKVVEGKKYMKVDIGTSGRYMVEIETGEIYGIKAYGVIHRGHHFGNLDTIDQYYWGSYRAVRKVGA